MLEITPRKLPKELQDIAAQNIGRGIETTFVLDNIEFRVDVNGKAMKATARGFAENGKVYIKVNNTFTAEQINGHETFHVEAARYPGEVMKLEDDINRVIPKNVMEVVIDKYRKGYSAVYDVSRITELAKEEILADIAGEMNPLSNIPEVREAVGRFYDEIYGKGAGEEFRKGIDSSRYSVNKEEAAGEPAAFSLGREADAADEIMGYFEGENGARSAGEEMSFEAMMEEAVRSQRETSQAEADAAASGIMEELEGEGGRFDSKNEDVIMKERGASEAKLTNSVETKVSINKKLETYLLDKNHIKGGSKAEWFDRALGFNQNNMDSLAEQIIFDPQTAEQTNVTQYGIQYNQIISITGANGKVIDVTFAWIKNEDGIIRLVTAIPTQK